MYTVQYGILLDNLSHSIETYGTFKMMEAIQEPGNKATGLARYKTLNCDCWAILAIVLLGNCPCALVPLCPCPAGLRLQKSMVQFQFGQTKLVFWIFL